MSPEQVRGQEVDKRTDIWAFGCVLYELLTGQRVFPSRSQSRSRQGAGHPSRDREGAGALHAEPPLANARGSDERITTKPRESRLPKLPTRPGHRREGGLGAHGAAVRRALGNPLAPARL